MRLLFLSGALIAASLLASCGFEPVYATKSGGAGGTLQNVAAVEIAPIPDRLGQILHEEVSDRLHPHGAAPPQYRLLIEPDSDVSRAGYRLDDSTTRRILRLRAAFRLESAAEETLLYDGEVFQTVTFDAVQSDYATLAAQEAAERRAARMVAEAIALRVAAYIGRAEAAATEQTDMPDMEPSP